MASSLQDITIVVEIIATGVKGKPIPRLAVSRRVTHSSIFFCAGGENGREIHGQNTPPSSHEWTNTIHGQVSCQLQNAWLSRLLPDFPVFFFFSLSLSLPLLFSI